MHMKFNLHYLKHLVYYIPVSMHIFMNATAQITMVSHWLNLMYEHKLLHIQEMCFGTT